MISKKEKILWVLYAAVLIVLFLLSSTNLIIKEQERQVYRISVIIDDDTDANYTNFRKGMEQAAMEWNADVSFLTLYEAGSHEQQMARVNREQQDGADALVVVPVDEERFAAEMSGGAATVPFVAVNTGTGGSRAAALLSVDYEEMGRLLGRQIEEDHEKGTPVWILSASYKDSASRHFSDGIVEVLKDAGFPVTYSVNAQEPSFLAETTSLTSARRTILVAADQQSLEWAASLLRLDRAGASSVEELYGRGTTQSVLNDLDRGWITGICVTDDYTMGYLSIRQAVAAIQGDVSQGETEFQSYYITKQELYQPQYEKMLYPVE